MTWNCVRQKLGARTAKVENPNLTPALAAVAPNDPSVSGQLVSWLGTNPAFKQLNGTSGVEVWLDEFATNDVDDFNAGTRPSVASGVRGGKDAVYFDGTDYLQGSWHTLFNGSDQPCSVVAVVRSDALNAGFQEVFAVGRVTDNDPLLAFGIGQEGIADYRMGRRDDAGVSALTRRAGSLDNDWHVVGYMFNGTGCRLYVDGVDIFTAESGMDVGTMTVDTLSIGALRRTTTTDHWIGMIGEVVVYTSGLDSTAMSGVSNYMRNKWDI